MDPHCCQFSYVLPLLSVEHNGCILDLLILIACLLGRFTLFPFLSLIFWQFHPLSFHFYLYQSFKFAYSLFIGSYSFILFYSLLINFTLLSYSSLIWTSWRLILLLIVSMTLTQGKLLPCVFVSPNCNFSIWWDTYLWESYMT